VKYLVQHKEGDHGGVTVCILITNPIPNEIHVYTFSICGGYFNPPISLTRSIISITRIVSAIGNISLSVFPSPTRHPYPTRTTYGLLVPSHPPASAFLFLESRRRASLACCLLQTSELYILSGEICRAGLSMWLLFR
jgi:hypothetical protein